MLPFNKFWSISTRLRFYWFLNISGFIYDSLRVSEKKEKVEICDTRVENKLQFAIYYNFFSCWTRALFLFMLSFPRGWGLTFFLGTPPGRAFSIKCFSFFLLRKYFFIFILLMLFQQYRRLTHLIHFLSSGLTYLIVFSISSRTLSLKQSQIQTWIAKVTVTQVLRFTYQHILCPSFYIEGSSNEFKHI